MAGRIHDRELLDAIECIEAETFEGDVWRVTRDGRDPTQAAPTGRGGRWDDGTFEALYTSMEPETCLREVYYHLSQSTPFPSRARYRLNGLAIVLQRALRLLEMKKLAAMGVPMNLYNARSFEKIEREVYPKAQDIRAAAHFLEFDGLLVPSARHEGTNVVLFLDRIGPASLPRLESSEPEPVDWAALKQG
jgi:RES domain-containing protein